MFRFLSIPLFAGIISVSVFSYAAETEAPSKADTNSGQVAPIELNFQTVPVTVESTKVPVVKKKSLPPKRKFIKARRQNSDALVLEKTYLRRRGRLERRDTAYIYSANRLGDLWKIPVQRRVYDAKDGSLRGVQVFSRGSWSNYGLLSEQALRGLDAMDPQAGYEFTRTQAVQEALFARSQQPEKKSVASRSSSSFKKSDNVWDNLESKLDAAESRKKELVALNEKEILIPDAAPGDQIGGALRGQLSKIEKQRKAQIQKELDQLNQEVAGVEKKKTAALIEVLEADKNEALKIYNDASKSGKERQEAYATHDKLALDLQAFQRSTDYYGYVCTNSRCMKTAEVEALKSSYFDKLGGTHSLDSENYSDLQGNKMRRDTVFVQHGDKDKKAKQKRIYKIDKDGKSILVGVSFLEANGQWSSQYAPESIPEDKQQLLAFEDTRVEADSQKRSPSSADQVAAGPNGDDEDSYAKPIDEAVLRGLVPNAQCFYNEDMSSDSSASDLHVVVTGNSCGPSKNKSSGAVCMGKVYCSTGERGFDFELSVACPAINVEECPGAKECALSKELRMWQNSGENYSNKPSSQGSSSSRSAQ